MGEEPIELDCAMFGMLAQLVWNMPGSPFERLLDSIDLIISLIPYFLYCNLINLMLQQVNFQI